MATPLLTTKLYIPPVRPEWVPRPRLVERLNAGLQGKLTLVSAPPGFGKTTLLGEWIAAFGSEASGESAIRHRVAWLSLDASDNDPTRFWVYLVAALQATQPGIGEAALAALQSPQPPPIEALLTGLINEIADRAQPVALILDDWHVITAPPINDALTFLLDHLPPQMHLVVASRADPPWPLARLRARREITELRAHDMRFTPEEVAAFLNEVMGLGLSAEDAAVLDARTEGWIAGLQMAALSMQGRKDVAAFIQAFSGSHHFVLDYLVEEVLDRQSSGVQDFLLKTCVLEQMTAPLCDAVTGRNDSQAILTQLERANLFLVTLDDERRWHRYHHLFSDLLRSRLEQTGPDQIPVLHRRASEWYERAQLMEEAVGHALAGKDWERAASLAEQYAEQMTIYGKQATLSGWIEALPDELLRTRPKLCVYHAGALHWVGLREQVEEYLQAAEQGLELASLSPDGEQRAPVLTQAEQRQIAGHIAAIRAHHALTNKEIPRVLGTAPKALELLPDDDFMRAYAATALGGAYWGQGDVVAAQQAFATARTVALKQGYRFVAVSPACYVGMLQAKQGLLHEAFQTYREALELATGPGGTSLPIAGFPNVRLGDVLREWNDLDAASRCLIKGVDQCLQLRQADVLTDGYVALARLQLAQGDRRGALDTVQKADQLAHQSQVDPFIICWLDDCRLRLWLSEDNLEAAVQWAQVSGLQVDGELSYHYDLHHINLARVLVAQGMRQSSESRLDEALVLLDRLVAATRKVGWINEEIKVLILRALAYQARGDSEAALDALDRALTLGEPGGYVRTFVDEGAPMGELLQHAAAHRIAVDSVGKLLAVLEKEKNERSRTAEMTLPFVPRPSSPAPATWQKLVEPISERELQVLRLLTTTLSTPEIAQELVVSTNTVRSHIKSIYGKLDVHSRADAVQRAKQLGLL